MAESLIIRVNEYQDSMVLLQINHWLTAMQGVTKAAILMASEPNKRILEKFGFKDPAIDRAGPGDLVIGLEADSERHITEALELIARLLSEKGRERKQRGRSFATLAAAKEALPGANLALISVPGAFAAREARRALERGMHAFIFSDNVPLAEEVELKKMAAAKGLLVMGPDCGTAIIDGVGLGFANQVQPGPVGLIGASGTGLQELCCLLENWGRVGVSQAIGLGGRDLSQAVGGISCLQALELLAADEASSALILVSKPPAPRVTEKVILRAGQLEKPIVLCFLGRSQKAGKDSLPPNLIMTDTLEGAAAAALKSLSQGCGPWGSGSRASLEKQALALSYGLGPKQKYLRGLFSGGSLCYEALTEMRGRLEPLFSNIPIFGVEPLPENHDGKGHVLLDLGEDELTQGRLHPMIDPVPVGERMVQEASDPRVGVILFDLVLGYGAHSDPAGVLAPMVEEARGAACSREPLFLAHVCGTRGDPQNLAAQEKRLQEAGVITADSNLGAARLAAAVLMGRAV